MRLSLIVIYCPAPVLDGARRFYGAVLDAEPAREQHGDGPEHWSIASDGTGLVIEVYPECGCCMANCPDVHPDSEGKLTAVPGSAVIAAEYAATLPEEKQAELREQEARGELRIAPQSEMGIDPDRVRILRSALRHSADHPDESERQ